MERSYRFVPLVNPPWERQPDEGPRAFECFTLFRNMGVGRTVVEAYRKSTGRGDAKQASGTWNDWVTNFRWFERANAWDDELDRQRDIGILKAARDMAARHANAAGLFQQKALARLQQIEPETLTPSQLARFFQLGVEIERLSRGEAAARISIITESDDRRASVVPENISPEAAMLALQLKRLLRSDGDDE